MGREARISQALREQALRELADIKRVCTETGRQFDVVSIEIVQRYPVWTLMDDQGNAERWNMEQAWTQGVDDLEGNSIVSIKDVRGKLSLVAAKYYVYPCPKRIFQDLFKDAFTEEETVSSKEREAVEKLIFQHL
jgi:hypothetical protein